MRFKPDQVKTVKPPVASMPQASAAASSSVSWSERVKDLIYFYDLYLLAGICIVGLLVYLVSSS